MPSVRFDIRECPFTPVEGDFVLFTTGWEPTTLSFKAYEVLKIDLIQGIVTATPDRKNIVIKAGRNRETYLIPESERTPHGIALKAGDRVNFIPQITTFLPAPEQRAIAISILAFGSVDALVEAPDSLPGRRKYTGCYIKWRQCDDGQGGQSADDRIFNLFVSDVEARYVLPGMRARAIPMLVTKKSTKRLNLTSKFGSFVCISDGIISELPDGGAPRPAPQLPPGSRSREGSVSSVGSASSADLVSIGKIKLSKQAPGACMNFTYGDVVTPLTKRSLRSGDRVELKFAPESSKNSISVWVTLTLEGYVRKRTDSDAAGDDSSSNKSSDESDDFYCNSELEIFCKSEDSPLSVGVHQDGDLVFTIDPERDEAVLGFLPLRVGDRVRFHVNERGMAENVSVISEVPGRIKAIGTVVLRDDPTVVALYPPKTFTKLTAGSYVLTRIDWLDTQFRILQMRLDPNSIGLSSMESSASKSSSRSNQTSTKQKKSKKPAQQLPLTSAIPRPTVAYVDKSPIQPNVKFHGTNPSLLSGMVTVADEQSASKSGWAAIASSPARPLPITHAPLVREQVAKKKPNQDTAQNGRSKSRSKKSTNMTDAKRPRKGRRARKTSTVAKPSVTLEEHVKPQLANLAAHIAAVVSAAEEAAMWSDRGRSRRYSGGSQELSDDYEDEYNSSYSGDSDSESVSDSASTLSASSFTHDRPGIESLFPESDEIVSVPRRGLIEQLRVVQPFPSRADPPPADASPRFPSVPTLQTPVQKPPIDHHAVLHAPGVWSVGPSSSRLQAPAPPLINVPAPPPSALHPSQSTLPFHYPQHNAPEELPSRVSRLSTSWASNSASTPRYGRPDPPEHASMPEIERIISNLSETADSTATHMSSVKSFDALNTLLQSIQDQARAAQEKLKQAHSGQASTAQLPPPNQLRPGGQDPRTFANAFPASDDSPLWIGAPSLLKSEVQMASQMGSAPAPSPAPRPITQLEDLSRDNDPNALNKRFTNDFSSFFSSFGK